MKLTNDFFDKPEEGKGIEIGDILYWESDDSYVMVIDKDDAHIDKNENDTDRTLVVAITGEDVGIIYYLESDNMTPVDKK